MVNNCMKTEKKKINKYIYIKKKKKKKKKKVSQYVLTNY